MNDKITIVLILILMILPVINADLIIPGYRSISINNYITNINDFPDYVFISGLGKEGFGPGIGMCELKVIEQDGLIEPYYKFCSISVYAIPKNNFNLNEIEEINQNGTMQGKELKIYLDSVNAKEIIESIDTSTEVPEASTQKEINNYYTISLEQTKTEPDKKEVKQNNLIYIYPLISFLSLGIIITILIKRKGIKND